MRIILGIIAFTLTFGLSASLVGLLFGFPQAETNFVSKYETVHKHKIKRLLKRDVRNGDIRDSAYKRNFTTEGGYEELYRNADYSESINLYYTKSSSMNDSALPADFKYAWREHLNAWKHQAAYVKSLQTSEYSENSDAVKNYSDNTDEINRTWYQVLRIAKRYGVSIDRSYFD